MVYTTKVKPNSRLQCPLIIMDVCCIIGNYDYDQHKKGKKCPKQFLLFIIKLINVTLLYDAISQA